LVEYKSDDWFAGILLYSVEWNASRTWASKS